MLGVTPSAVSRWRTATSRLAPGPTACSETIEVIHEGVKDFDVEVLEDIGLEPGTPLRLRVRMKDGQWKAAA